MTPTFSNFAAPTARPLGVSGLAVVAAIALSMLEMKMTKTTKAKPKKPMPARAAKPARATATKPKAAKTNTTANTASPARENTKLANLVALLCGKDGATLEQMMKATGWQAHSVRGAISGTLKKKMGLTVTSAKADGIRIYRIAG